MPLLRVFSLPVVNRNKAILLKKMFAFDTPILSVRPEPAHDKQGFV